MTGLGAEDRELLDQLRRGGGYGWTAIARVRDVMEQRDRLAEQLEIVDERRWSAIRGRMDARAERDEAQARTEKALAIHKPGPMLDHYEYGCICGYRDHRWAECEGCHYVLDDEGELDRGFHGRICPTVAALSGSGEGTQQ